MSKLRTLRPLLWTLPFLLSGCVDPVDWQSFDFDAPALWHQLNGQDANADLTAGLVSSPDAEIEQSWWKHFADPTLDTLIAQALSNNKSLLIAKSRIEEARATRRIAYSELVPLVTANPSVTRGNQGYTQGNVTSSSAGVTVNASWDLDLFGRNQALTARATALLQSTEASQQAIRVSLLADVAQAYFDLRNEEQQIALTLANLETERKTQALTVAQKQGGLASDFDVQRAGAQVSTTEAQIPALQTAYDNDYNRLHVLLGVTPGTLDELLKAPHPALVPLDPHVVIAAPAKIIAARPDVRVAERNFAATISATKAAKAQLFPDISLTGLFGIQTASGFGVLYPWSAGLSIVQPISNITYIHSLIDQANQQQSQAYLTYQETVLEALQNMENALSGYIHETIRNQSLTRSVRQNSKAVELAQQQSQNGDIALLDVLVAERNLLNAQSDQATSDANLRKYLVNIYTAAGGGWQDEETGR